MFIETYQVEEELGRKVIHYNGFTWERDTGGAEAGLRPYAATEGTFCYVDVGEHNFERAAEAFELVLQYQYDLAESELLDWEAYWKENGERLHMDEVTQDTPCGMYWF